MTAALIIVPAVCAAALLITRTRRQATAAWLIAGLVCVAILPVLPSQAVVFGQSLELSPLGRLGAVLLVGGAVGCSLMLELSRDEQRGGDVAHALAAVWTCVALLIGVSMLASLEIAALLWSLAGLVLAVTPQMAASTPEAKPDEPALEQASIVSLSLMLLLVGYWAATQPPRPEGPSPSSGTTAFLALGFAVALGIPPFHAWLVNSTTRRHGWLTLVLVQQTGAVVLLITTLERTAWLLTDARVRGLLVVGGAVVGLWAALMASLWRDDDGAWLAYASLANVGLLMAGLGSTPTAAFGTGWLLLTRPAALLAVSLASGQAGPATRWAGLAGGLSLAGAPPLAGWHATWLIVSGAATRHVAVSAVLLGAVSATAISVLSRFAASGHAGSPWPAEPPSPADSLRAGWLGYLDLRRTVTLGLTAWLIVGGLLPQLTWKLVGPAMASLPFPPAR
jgi:NADH:ubiquinone oxidoreductase subunit 2 (subunit N)